MRSFRSFMSEAVTTKRQSMVHFEKMKPAEFIDMLLTWQKEFGAILKNDVVDISLKVDGAGFRIGRDEKGRFFVESSRSGPIYTQNAFSTFAKSRGADQEKLSRAYLYDQMFTELSKSKLAKVIPPNCKVVCEMLFNPMSQDLGSTRKFVSIEYDKAKLGNQMTIVLISAMGADGTPWSSQNTMSLFEMLKGAGDNNIKVMTAGLSFKAIDVSVFAKNIEGLIGSFPDYKTLLVSRKGADKMRKEILIHSIDKIKTALARTIIGHPLVGRDVLGPNEEGLVLNIGGKLYKIQSDIYKRGKQ